MRKRHCAQLIFAVGLISGTGFPQPAAGAREHYARALEFVAHGEPEAAVVEFEAAYRIRPNYLVQYNLGQAYLELGNPVAAQRAFDIYLRDGGGEVPPERQQEVQALLASCKKRVGYAVFEVELPGAEVSVDGRVVGQSPLDAVTLAIGTHSVTASAPGRLPFVGRVEIESQKEVSLHVVFEPEPGAPLTFGQLGTHCAIPDATWELDGRPLAARDGQPQLVSSGAHRIRSKRDGYLPSEQELELAENSITYVDCNLRVDPRLPASAKGILSFQISEPEAIISLDGQRTARTVNVPAGPHFVRVRSDGFDDWTATVTARPSFPNSIQVHLHATEAHALALERASRNRRNWAYVIGGAGVGLLGTSLALFVNSNHRYSSWQHDNETLGRDLRAGADSVELNQEVTRLREGAVSIQTQDDWAVGVGVLGAGLLSYAVISWLATRPTHQ